MSWVEYEDTALGRVVVELQPSVIEVFRSRVPETLRVHLRMLAIEHRGPDGNGNQLVRIVQAGGPGLELTVPEVHWARVWPLLEQARAAQYPFLAY